MAPNLFVGIRTLFTPQTWFCHKSCNKRSPSVGRLEHWDSPIPGTYEYIPGRGWYLIATDSPSSMKKRQPVSYCQITKTWVLQSDFEERSQFAVVDIASGKHKRMGFYRLDDGIAYVMCWNGEGAFLPGPWERWCLDKETRKFRRMLIADDPNRTRGARDKLKN
ncbi:MAG: hypothetical protein M1812_004158 [Candelaria pacifica]|nr:MAG: hypothetical protein M1812_004158 [Candelaria pacifica]